MRINLNDMLYAFSYALDCVEHDVVGVTTNHGKRVAFISVLLGRELQMSEEELLDFAACAVLHDNAITEFAQEEYSSGMAKEAVDPQYFQTKIGKHCVMGEKNISLIPLRTDVKDVILYHHERADGTGPFGKKEEDTNIKAQIIHIADDIDAKWDLSYMNAAKYRDLIEYVKNEENKGFSSQCVELFMNAVDEDILRKMQSERIDVLIGEILPIRNIEYTDQEIRNIAAFFGRIVDYKSEFTRYHSMGIAEKAEIMAKFYGYDTEKVTKMYLAGALHDIGKLVVDKDVLEKPDKLTDEEFTHIKNHAFYTYDIMRKIKGFEEITNWSALHHEKLNGNGYPFRKRGEELSKEERLMGCIDIYQALTEKRPYKDGFSHEKSISIMKDMAKNNFIDGDIVNDIDRVFGEVTYE